VVPFIPPGGACVPVNAKGDCAIPHSLKQAPSIIACVPPMYTTLTTLNYMQTNAYSRKSPGPCHTPTSQGFLCPTPAMVGNRHLLLSKGLLKKKTSRIYLLPSFPSVCVR